MGLLNISLPWHIHALGEIDMSKFKKHVLAEAGSPSSKAAALLARGAYSQYVSTAQWRERRWRLFQHSHYGQKRLNSVSMDGSKLVGIQGDAQNPIVYTS